MALRRRWTKLAGPSQQPSFELTAPRKVVKPAYEIDQGLVERLPTELVSQIILLLEGPFDHDAILTMTPFGSPVDNIQMWLGVHKCRNWQDIAMYQVNKMTRETALRLYGTPHRNGFPFDPTIDTMADNLNQEGVFLTGVGALSTIINSHITEFTVRTLDGEDIVVGHEMLRVGPPRNVPV
jgi:hypothetical protein